MIDLLDGFTFGQILLMLSFILIAISSLVLVIVFKVPFKLKGKGGSSLTFNTKKEDTLKEKITMQKKDLLVVMGKISDIATEQLQLKKVETLNSQMSFAEEKIRELRTLLDTKFIEILKQKTEPKKQLTIIFNEDFKVFSLVIKSALEKIMNSFRTSCRINHFYEYNEERFLLYAEKSSSNYVKIITDSIKKDCFIRKEITPEEIIEVIERDISSKAKELFIILFSKARKISSENSLKITELDFNLLDFITNYLDIEITREERFIFIKGIDSNSEKEVRRRIIERY